MSEYVIDLELTNEIRVIRGIDARGGVCIASIHFGDSRFAVRSLIFILFNNYLQIYFNWIVTM